MVLINCCVINLLKTLWLKTATYLFLVWNTFVHLMSARMAQSLGARIFWRFKFRSWWPTRQTEIARRWNSLHNLGMSLYLCVVSPAWDLQGRQVYLPAQSSQGRNLEREREKERKSAEGVCLSITSTRNHSTTFFSLSGGTYCGVFWKYNLLAMLFNNWSKVIWPEFWEWEQWNEIGHTLIIVKYEQ